MLIGGRCFSRLYINGEKKSRKTVPFSAIMRDIEIA